MKLTRTAFVALLTVAPVLADGTLPYIVDGGGWSSTISITNLTPEPTRITLEFVAADNHHIALPLVGGGSFTHRDINLLSRQSHVIETAGDAGAPRAGYVYIRGDAVTVAYTVTIRRRVPGVPDAEAAYSLTPDTECATVLSFDHRSGGDTGIAFVNPDLAINLFRVALHSDFGDVLEEKTVSLNPWNQNVLSIRGLFPGKSGGIGSVRISIILSGRSFCSSIPAVGFRFSPNGGLSSASPHGSPY